MERSTGPDRYGKYYWCIKTDLSPDGEIYAHADCVLISENGELQLLQNLNDGSRNILLAFASGNWKCIFAASVFDGNAVCAEHWKNEIASNENQ